MTKEEIIEKIKDIKEVKKKKSKKDTVNNLDEILYGKDEEHIDFGDSPDFLSLGKGKNKEKREDIPEYLKY